jgi:DNA-damage-inducible protein J
MAASTMIHVRINMKLKARAEKALGAMGISVSDAVRMLLMRVAAEQALPFDVRVPNAATRKAMVDARRGATKRLRSLPDLLRNLDASD